MLQIGMKVRWTNDKSPIVRPWAVQKPGDAWVRITDNLRAYPKSESFYVPIGAIAPWSHPRPSFPLNKPQAAAPAELFPSRNPKAAAHSPDAPRSLEDFKRRAAEAGLDAHDMERITEIWNNPAPNKPMIKMRIHNYIRNRIRKIQEGVKR